MNAKLFKFIRQSQGLTQQEVADMLGVSKTLVCLIERNKKDMSDRVKKRFRETFGAEYVDRCRSFMEQK